MGTVLPKTLRRPVLLYLKVTAWGCLALLKRMLDGMGLHEALQSRRLPQPGSNRDYAPEQLIERMIVSIWCGAARVGCGTQTKTVV